MRFWAGFIGLVLISCGSPTALCGCTESVVVRGVVTLDDGPAEGWDVRLDLVSGSACSECSFPPTGPDGRYMVTISGPTDFCQTPHAVYVRPPDSLSTRVTPTSASSEIHCGENERNFAFQTAPPH